MAVGFPRLSTRVAGSHATRIATPGILSRKGPGAERVQAHAAAELLCQYRSGILHCPRDDVIIALPRPAVAGVAIRGCGSHTRAAAVMGSGPGSPLRTGAPWDRYRSYFDYCSAAGCRRSKSDGPLARHCPRVRSVWCSLSERGERTE